MFRGFLRTRYSANILAAPLIASWVSRLSQGDSIRKAAESILFFTGKWILVAILAVYLLGVASYPVFAELVTWLEKIL